MAYIDLNNDLPGIRGLMMYRPAAAKALNALAEILLRDDNNSLSRGERELIGSYVSSLNECFFCENVHGALACHYLEYDLVRLNAIKKDFLSSTDISDKMKALLNIAGKVQGGGKQVSPEHIAEAVKSGATDTEIHDTVLIAASFCMFNRYVDGLGTWAPAEQEFYMQRAPMRAEEGYVNTDK